MVKINWQASITLLITAIIIHSTPGKSAISTAATISKSSDDQIIFPVLFGNEPIHRINKSDQLQARIEQLRQEIAYILIQELGVASTEAQKIISIAKYLTPSGRDINKIGLINSKLNQLKQLENSK